MPKITTVDEYINQFSGEAKARLEHMREIIRAEAPSAEESLSYGMVGYKLHGKPLVYFGGFAHHIGFYATPNGHEAFKKELAHYKQGKGSVQFPLEQPLPEELVIRIIAFRRAAVAGDNRAVKAMASSGGSRREASGLSASAAVSSLRPYAITPSVGSSQFSTRV